MIGVSLVHYIREVLHCCWNSTSLQKGKFMEVIHKALIEDLIMAFPTSFITLTHKHHRGSSTPEAVLLNIWDNKTNKKNP